jgi:hypothetical protein
MSYTPFNESLLVIRGNSNQDGIDITPISQLIQGNEIRDPLRLRKGVLPYMGMRAIRVDEQGLLDKSIEINDLGQDIKSSTTSYVDTTERWTPTQIILGDLSESFLSELVTQQTINEKNDGQVSIFEPYGIEVPFSSRGAKGSLNGENEYIGTQLLDSRYQLLDGLDDFLDGQEEDLGLAIPAIQSMNDQILKPFEDLRHDDTDRFGINILNQNVNLYDRYAAGGFVYAGNDRDSIAFGGFKG